LLEQRIEINLVMLAVMNHLLQGDNTQAPTKCCNQTSWYSFNAIKCL